MPKTPAEMIEAVTRNLQKNTGKTVDEWTALLRKKGPKSDEKAQYAWLRDEGLGHVAAKILSGGLKPYEEPAKLKGLVKRAGADDQVLVVVMHPSDAYYPHLTKMEQNHDQQH